MKSLAGHAPILIYFYSESQSSKESQVSVVLSEKVICDEPCLRAFLKTLQVLLDRLNLGGVASICRIIELRH